MVFGFVKPGGFDVDRIYIRILYLKSLHYFFFSLAVMSLTAGIMFFDLTTWESLNFFVLGYFYFAASLVIAYYFYKDYRETLEPIKVVRFYLLPYMVLVFFTIGFMVLFVLTAPSIIQLIQSFLFVDYYVFFLIAIGFLLSRFKLVSRLFEMYNVFVFRKAKKLAKKYAYLVNIDEYEIGSSPEIDEIFDEIWIHKNYPLPYIRKLEIAICERHIVKINRALVKMRGRGVDESGKKVIEALEKLKQDYFEKIRKIEEKVD